MPLPVQAPTAPTLLWLAAMSSLPSLLKSPTMTCPYWPLVGRPVVMPALLQLPAPSPLYTTMPLVPALIKSCWPSLLKSPKATSRMRPVLGRPVEAGCHTMVLAANTVKVTTVNTAAMAIALATPKRHVRD